MRELPDDELVLYYYGEGRRPEKIRRLLDESPAVRRRYDELCRVLAAVDEQPVPERGDGYGGEVWQRLHPRLGERPAPWWRRLAAVLAPPRLAAAGALAGMLALAFLAGRTWSPPSTPEAGPALSAAGRERILTTVVAEHLERSERLLLELANAPGGGVAGGLDVGPERGDAAALLASNRLYRQTSELSGRTDVAAVLDELERLLLDVARGPEEITADDVETFRARTDALLFKVQVLGWRLNSQQPNHPPRRGPQA